MFDKLCSDTGKFLGVVVWCNIVGWFGLVQHGILFCGKCGMVWYATVWYAVAWYADSERSGMQWYGMARYGM